MIPEVIAAYQRLYEITSSKCDDCGRCCNPQQCAEIEETAKALGADIPALPESGSYIVNNRCMLEPHQRPVCTVHHCKIGSLGFFPGDAETTKAYFDARDALLELGHTEFIG